MFYENECDVYAFGSFDQCSVCGGIGIAFSNIEKKSIDLPVDFFNDREPLTPNRVKLWAVYKALDYILQDIESKNDTFYTVYTDSEYAVQCIYHMCWKWLEIYGPDPNLWRTQKGTPVMNAELISECNKLGTKINKAYQDNGWGDFEVKVMGIHERNKVSLKAKRLSKKGLEQMIVNKENQPHEVQEHYNYDEGDQSDLESIDNYSQRSFSNDGNDVEDQKDAFEDSVSAWSEFKDDNNVEYEDYGSIINDKLNHQAKNGSNYYSQHDNKAKKRKKNSKNSAYFQAKYSLGSNDKRYNQEIDQSDVYDPSSYNKGNSHEKYYNRKSTDIGRHNEFHDNDKYNPIYDNDRKQRSEKYYGNYKYDDYEISTAKDYNHHDNWSNKGCKTRTNSGSNLHHTDHKRLNKRSYEEEDDFDLYETNSKRSKSKNYESNYNSVGIRPKTNVDDRYWSKQFE